MCTSSLNEATIASPNFWCQDDLSAPSNEIPGAKDALHSVPKIFIQVKPVESFDHSVELLRSWVPGQVQYLTGAVGHGRTTLQLALNRRDDRFDLKDVGAQVLISRNFA